MRRLRMGIIGLGGIAQMMHLPHMADHRERFELVAFADTHEPTLRSVGEHYHVSHLYADYHDMLRQEQLDAVGIFHGGSHRDTVIDSLAAGLDVFVEKPLAWNVAEVEDVVAAKRASDRIVQVGYHKRYDPGYIETKKLLKDMHDLAYVRITVLHPEDSLGWSTHRVRRGSDVIIEGHRPAPTFDQALVGAREGLAGGPLTGAVDAALGPRKDIDHLRLAFGMMTVSLIHQLYSLWGLLGAPDRVRHTDLWRGGLSMHSVFVYPTGLNVTLDWHWLASLKDYREEYAFFANDSRVYLTFPSPYLRNFPTPIVVQGHEGEVAWEKRIVVSYEEPFLRELLAFHHNVVTRTDPETGVEEALEHARFIQQMIDAAD